MSEYCPRLSEAKELLPLIRSHLAGAASRNPLPGGLSLDLIPIVDDGLFGYELVPDRETRAFLTIGCNGTGVPMLRKTSYGVDASNGLRLASSHGLAVQRNASPLRPVRDGDSYFSDWSSAIASLWSQLAVQAGDKPRQLVTVNEGAHRYLDEALAVAYSHLAAWDPHIRFFGLPNEAQYGFPLYRQKGEHGELVAQRPDIWILRWK